MIEINFLWNSAAWNSDINKNSIVILILSVNKTIYKEYKCLYEVLMRSIVNRCGCYPSYVR